MNDPATGPPDIPHRQFHVLFVGDDSAAFTTLTSAADAVPLSIDLVGDSSSADLMAQVKSFAPDVVVLSAAAVRDWSALDASQTELFPVVGWIGIGAWDVLSTMAAIGIRDFLYEDSLEPQVLEQTVYCAVRRTAAAQDAVTALAPDLFHPQHFQGALLDVINVPVIILSTEGTVVQMNRVAETLFGYAQNDLVGTLIWKRFFSAEEIERLRDWFAKVLRGEKTDSIEVELLPQDEETRTIMWTGTRYTDPDRGITYVIGAGLDVTIRRQTEAAMRKNASMFRAIFYDSTLGMTLVDEQGRVLESNPAAHWLLGFTPDELEGQPFSFYSHPDDDARDRALFESLVQNRISHYEIEKRYLRKDSDIRWGRLTVSALHGEDHGERFFIRMAEDITARKLTEQAEAEQLAFIEALQGMSSALTSTLDPDEVLDRLLVEIESVVPYDRATIMLVEGGRARVVRCAGSHLPLEEREALIGCELEITQVWNLQHPLETRAPLIIPDVRQDESWFNLDGMEWVRAHMKAPIQVEGRVIGFLGLESATPDFYREFHANRLLAFANQAAVAIRNAQLFDTVRRYAVELEQRVEERTAELANERAQLRAILDAMGEGLVYVEGEGSLGFVNRAFAELTGFSVEEVLQAPDVTQDILTRTIGDRATWVNRVQGTIRAGRTWRGEIVFQRRDGSRFDAGLIVTSVNGADGTMLGQVYLIRDISSEKALQAQKDRFIANASHELRTPLTNIKMRLYLIRKRPLQADDHLHVMEQVANRMEELIDDLLDVTRFERGVIDLNRTDTILQRLVDHVVSVQRPHAEAKNIRLETDYPDEALHVLADPKRMTQVVTNLLTNAINYTPPEGRIAVRLKREIDQDGAYGVIQVQDSGQGIKPDALSSIFEPFYRAQEGTAKGSGLGLTISKEIVDRHGGTIWADSQIHKGSIFSVRLHLLTNAPKTTRK